MDPSKESSSPSKTLERLLMPHNNDGDSMTGLSVLTTRMKDQTLEDTQPSLPPATTSKWAPGTKAVLFESLTSQEIEELRATLPSARKPFLLYENSAVKQELERHMKYIEDLLQRNTSVEGQVTDELRQWLQFGKKVSEQCAPTDTSQQIIRKLQSCGETFAQMASEVPTVKQMTEDEWSELLRTVDKLLKSEKLKWKMSENINRRTSKIIRAIWSGNDDKTLPSDQHYLKSLVNKFVILEGIEIQDQGKQV